MKQKVRLITVLSAFILTAGSAVCREATDDYVPYDSVNLEKTANIGSTINRAADSIDSIDSISSVSTDSTSADNAADSIGSTAQDGENQKFVYLLNSDLLRYDKFLNPDAQILIGNVTFRHDSMYMYCDSALFYQEMNSFEAYHNVRMEQGDTLFLFGDSLFYDGNTRIARVRDNVRLENRSMVLLTDSLNYDRNIGIGWFFDGGTLLDEESTLISEYGQFEVETKLATFIRDVMLESPDYNLTSDTLHYNTDLHKAFIVSPTTIISEDNTIQTSRGSFNSDTGDALLLNRSEIIQNDGETKMTGDSIIYSESEGSIFGYGNVLLNDYANKIDISGDFACYFKENDSAVVTDESLLIEYSSGDSLYVHADTFRLTTFYNETGDTVINRHVRAFNRVKAYRHDLQMIADSAQFCTADTTLTLFQDPILWSDNQQILGEKMIFYLNDSTIERAEVLGQALFIQDNDSLHYNQITGREMYAWFINGEIDKADVKGNVLAIFYPIDDADTTMIGMNTLEASHLTIHFVNRTVEKIVVHGRSSGVMYPMSKLDEKKMYLANFNWFDRLRPLSRIDVFYWRAKLATEQLKQTITKEVPLPTLPKKENN
ncbi:MAG: OstA-like protein [Bacteroidaceae bacterium]